MECIVLQTDIVEVASSMGAKSSILPKTLSNHIVEVFSIVGEDSITLFECLHQGKEVNKPIPGLQNPVQKVTCVTHGLLVCFLVLRGVGIAYCTDMGLCECGLPFLEPSDLSLVSMRTSDGGLAIR